MKLKDIANQLWTDVKNDGKIKLPIEPIPFQVTLDRQTQMLGYTLAGSLVAGLVISALINNYNSR